MFFNLKGKLTFLVSLFYFFSYFLYSISLDNLKHEYERLGDEYVKYIKKFSPDDPIANRLKKKLDIAKKRYILYKAKLKKVFTEKEIDDLIGFDYMKKNNILKLTQNLTWKADFKLALLNIRFYNFDDAVLLLDIAIKKLTYLSIHKDEVYLFKSYCLYQIADMNNDRDSFLNTQKFLENIFSKFKDSYYKKKAKIILDKIRASVIIIDSKL